jgi:hypothetical protein
MKVYGARSACATRFDVIDSGMDEVTKQKHRIQAAVRRGAVSKLKLSRLAGLRDTVLIGMDDPAWNPRVSTLSALVRALDSMGFPRRPRLSRGNGESRAA